MIHKLYVDGTMHMYTYDADEAQDYAAMVLRVFPTMVRKDDTTEYPNGRTIHSIYINTPA